VVGAVRAMWSGKRKLGAIGVGALLMLAVVGAATPPWARATFPGRDGRVVFTRFQGKGQVYRERLFTMNPDGTAIRLLTDPAWGWFDSDPVWSPDGSQIVFGRTGPDGNGQIYTIDADGTHLRKLTHCASGSVHCLASGSPTWTPDGRTIVFSHCCVPGAGGDHVGLFTMRADGSHWRRITLDPDLNFADAGPTVSPDGRWVAFSRQVGATPGNANTFISALCLVRIDGGKVHCITSNHLIVDEKDWSPDGSRIVFVSHEGSNHGPFRADIFTVAPDGSHLTQLTHTIPGRTLAFQPCWAPSGDRIMFDYSTNANGTDIFTMKPDGSDRRRVMRTPQFEFGNNWGSAPLA